MLSDHRPFPRPNPSRTIFPDLEASSDGSCSSIDLHDNRIKTLEKNRSFGSSWKTKLIEEEGEEEEEKEGRRRASRATMSDEEHHFESKADAGASKTYPQQAGTIRKNGYIVIKGRPCKVSFDSLFFLFLS